MWRAMKIHCTLSRTFRGMAAAPRPIPALCKCLGQTQPITLHPRATWFSSRPVNRISFTSISRAAFTSAGTQLSSVTEHRDAGSSGAQLPHATSDSAFEGSTEYNKDEKFGTKLPSATAKPVVESSNTYSDSESSWRKVPSATAKRMLKGISGYNGGESSRTFATDTRLKEVIDLNDIMNKVEFVGLIVDPVRIEDTDSGQRLARTALKLNCRGEDDQTWLELLFWDELAETAAEHVKENDTVYVSGRLVSQTSAIKDDNPLKGYKVIVNKLNFIGSSDHSVSEKMDVNNNTPFPDVHQQAVANRHTPFQHEESPVKSSTSDHSVSKKVDVNNNTPFPDVHQQAVANRYTPFQHEESPVKSSTSDVHQQAVANRYTPFQHEESPVKSSTSGKKTGDHATELQSLWEEFFASPSDWLDSRKTKEDSGSPDFKHKVTNKKLSINNPSNPRWIKFELEKWDGRNASGEC